MRRFAMVFVAAACVLLTSGTAEARGRRCGGCHNNCGGKFSGGYYGTNNGFYYGNGINNNVYWNGTSWQQTPNVTAPMPANTNTTPNTTNQQNTNQTTNPQNPNQQNTYYYGNTNVTPGNSAPCTNCYPQQQNNFFHRRIFFNGGCAGCR